MEPAEITLPNACVRMQRRWLRPAPVMTAIGVLVIASLASNSSVFLWIGVGAAVVLLADHFQLSRHRLTTVRVDRHGVRFTDRATDTEEFMASDNVERLSVQQGPRSFELRIEPKTGPTWAVSLAAGQTSPTTLGMECSALMGLGPDRRLMEFKDPQRFARLVVSWAVGALLGGLIGGTIISSLGWYWSDSPTQALLYGSVAIATVVVGWATRTVDLAVGADGIVLRGPWRRRDIPYADITNVIWERGGVLVIHASGRRGLRVSEAVERGRLNRRSGKAALGRRGGCSPSERWVRAGRRSAGWAGCASSGCRRRAARWCRGPSTTRCRRCARRS